MHGFLAQLANLFAGGIGLEKGVIDEVRDFGVDGANAGSRRDAGGAGVDDFLRLVNAEVSAALAAFGAGNVRDFETAKIARRRCAQIEKDFFGDGLDDLFELPRIHQERSE